VQRSRQCHCRFSTGSRVVANPFIDDVPSRLVYYLCVTVLRSRFSSVRSRFSCLFLTLSFLFNSHPLAYVVYFHFNSRWFSSKHCLQYVGYDLIPQTDHTWICDNITVSKYCHVAWKLAKRKQPRWHFYKVSASGRSAILH